MSSFDAYEESDPPMLAGSILALARADNALADIGRNLARLHNYGSGVDRDELALRHEAAMADVHESKGEEQELAIRRVKGIARHMQVDALWPERERLFVAVEEQVLDMAARVNDLLPDDADTEYDWDGQHRFAQELSWFATDLDIATENFPVLIAGQIQTLALLAVSRALLLSAAQELHSLAVMRLRGEVG